MMKEFEIQALGMQTANGEYAGNYSPTVEKIIRNLLFGKVLHLFSGNSDIGEERLDATNPNATINVTVEAFIKSDKRDWDWMILAISNHNYLIGV